ncbi:Pentatricopeptide repeat-containing protein [Zea mays]|uniref:Pentatricopeptide repeat-containing protein n=2 Tax=Zea mays TaxID=4577 RepID=A0A1D6HGR0_MAIZE|nr:Pentatricopeptide repeat-containing protein [Zea mays]PWZ21242.1 Pentatricopeptide repeat-containing protein [Zea mays]
MVGGLVLSQAQTHQAATPRTAAPAPAPAQALEKRPRDQAQPCGTVAAAAAVSVSAPSLDEVRKVHARHIKLGLDRCPRYARPLLAACAVSGWPGGMELAASIFESLVEPEAFDYNTLMRGHVSGGGGDRDPAAALRLYIDGLEAGVSPDSYTFPFVLKACAQLAALQEGRQLQAHIVKLGFQHDEHVQNSLISFYGKCGAPAMARLAFDRVEAEERTTVSWSALLAAYTKAGLWGECLASFGSMMLDGWRPDESSMVSALSACAHLGSFDAGRSVHCALLRNTARLNTIMLTSLLDMYAKCGSIEKAAAAFDAMDDKSAWAYSAMLSGLALHGDGRKALQVFDAMVREGHAPDAAAYVGVLNACSRAGLLEDGLRCFDRMRLEHKVAPNALHYGCMVDLMARAGRLDDARALIGTMPTGPTDTAWRSLLNACRIHGDLDLAWHALQELRRLGAANAGDYVIVADMHARAKNWTAAAALRTEAVDSGLAQSLGFSAVEVRGELHRFVSQDMAHPRTRDIYEMLHQMEWQLRFDGYKPDTSEVALDAGEEEKGRVVAAHSQKLAMAFGLLSTPEGAPVRVVTNLRMSKECHAYSALISEIFGRDIVIRDRNRLHRFRCGTCSCRDYW